MTVRRRWLTKRYWLIGALGVLALGVCGYPFFRDAYVPMHQHESQCLICHRNRVEKWIDGVKVEDSIASNRYSDWIDSFVPTPHTHIWSVHTSYHRSEWFADTSIACGGLAVIPRIFERRANLGEQRARRLAKKWHKLVRAQYVDGTVSQQMVDFNEVVANAPENLLQSE